ncbi:MAG TPA: hypothetical protein VL125_17165 [Pelobium sp.]|nr:hypothetical protein [Pelobium sp.]
MKKITKILTLLVIAGLCIFTACKKDDVKISSEDEVVAGDFTYNLATKKVTPNETVNAQITSPAGVKFIYCYLVRSNAPDSIIYTYYPTEDANNVNLEIPTESFLSATTNISGVKLSIKHLDNSSDEGFINVTAFTPPLPKLTDFPTELLPDDNDKIVITGKASSENGVKKIEIFDDSAGDFTLVNTIDNLNDAQEVDVNYTYTYRSGTANLKVLVTDNFDLKDSININVPVLPYTLYSDVTMGAQGTASVTVNNNFFIAATGQLLGSCELASNEDNMDFLFYATNSNASFYSPANTSGVAKNYRCNGVAWTINNPSAQKATKFRVLVTGSSSTDLVYAKVEANEIADLTDDGLFAGITVPGSSTVKYSETETPSPTASFFNASTAYLIWAKIPNADGTSTNCLIRVKEVNYASTTGLSTVKCDIFVQKHD